MDDVLWREVEAALDARVDPRDVPEIATRLAKDPEAAREVRRLVERLACLRDVPGRDLPAREQARPRSLRRAASLLAAALFLGATASLYLLRDAPARIEHSPRAASVDGVTLRVERTHPAPVRGARVVLQPKRVVQWTLEGESP